ncbi:aspartate dehydrogenase [Lentibacillus lipolyticus]|nr:aspartate dehydrogenase [Lentibacillus lipolyticus]
MNIGIVGAGAIANFLMKEINQNGTGEMQIKSVFVRDPGKYQELEHQFDVKLFDHLDAFLTSGIDIVVEAANIAAVHEWMPKILPKKDVVLISIGALADAGFLREMNDLAEMYERSIHLPSGAIGGLDLLQNAHADGGVSDVSITTRKPARTLMNHEAATEEVIVFDGKASEAIKQFPKNINVSIILSLAGVGVEQTNVTIIADPAVENNIHTIDIKGDFGTASFSVTNNPLAANPKTSYLAAMSILGTLKRLTNPIKIGG